MTILQSLYYLLKQMLFTIFLQLPPPSHIGQQISSSTYLHHKHYMLQCFKWLIQSHYIPVPSPPQYLKLLHFFLHLRLFFNCTLVYWFQSYKFLRESMNSQVYFTKGSLTHNFTNLVEIRGDSRRIISSL